MIDGVNQLPAQTYFYQNQWDFQDPKMEVR